MKEAIDYITSRLPENIKGRNTIALLLWIGCEYGSGNAIVGLFSPTDLAKISLNAVASALNLKNWHNTGRKCDWNSCMLLLQQESEDEQINALLRELDENSKAGKGVQWQTKSK